MTPMPPAPPSTPVPPTAMSDDERFRRNLPSLLCDLGLGLLFFVVAKFAGLTTAAMVGAAAGLALVVVQRFVKVDLLGGLAMFGVVMLLVSAAFSWALQDDFWVKMKSTLLGCFVAALFLTDGLLAGGRWLGARLARYMPYPDVQPGRLAVGMGVMGLLLAGLNWGVATWFSTDAWLWYTTFGDTALAFVLALGAVRWSRVPPRFRNPPAG